MKKKINQKNIAKKKKQLKELWLNLTQKLNEIKYFGKKKKSNQMFRDEIVKNKSIKKIIKKNSN
jgi:hypothetical protein